MKSKFVHLLRSNSRLFKVMDLQVEGKVYMVAASSKGLGFGIAQELSKNGAIVCLASRTKEDLENASEKLRKETGATIHTFVFDASNADSIQNWINEVENTFERIDGLVVNAGGPPPGNFDDFSDEDWYASFNLTLMSAVRLIRGVLPSMRKSGSGSILTIASVSVKEPVNRLLLSNELAKENIRVNNLLPGKIDTDRVQSLDKDNAEKTGTPVEEIKSKNESIIPLGRYGNISEFGKAGAFLISPAASYITGVSLAVDGGTLKTVW